MSLVRPLAATLVASAVCVRAAAAGVPDDAAVRTLVCDHLDAIGGRDAGVGFVVGIVEPSGRRIVACGDAGPGRTATGDTVFETGSVGKVFTALVLADMVVRGDVALADPVARLLPRASIPKRGGREITLADLATHTSGLPFLTDERPAISRWPYDPARLLRFLARTTLPRDPGAGWDYSNLGYWLLGKALEARAGKPIGALLETRVFAPLGLHDTAVAVTPRLAPRMAVGHDAILRPSMAPDAVDVYAALGPATGMGVVSTANDLLTFVAVAMGQKSSSLAPALAAMLDTRRSLSPAGGAEQALGWIVTPDGLVTHDGGTWGFASSVAWDPKARAGVVVLSNQLAPVDDLAVHLLRPEAPLRHPVVAKRVEIPLDPTARDACPGRYEVEDEGPFVVARDGGALVLDVPVSWGLPRLRLRPESRTDFFAAELPIRVAFEWVDGRVAGLRVKPPRGERWMAARRVE